MAIHLPTLDGESLQVSFEYENVILGNEKLTWFGSNELTLIVYDTLTHEAVDVVSFSTLDGCALARAAEE